MNDLEVLRTLNKVGAVITGSHIVYKSWKHGSAYINKDAVYPYTGEISKLCRAISKPFSILEKKVEIVVGPAIGGVVLSQWTAHHLSELQGNEVLSIFAEKDVESFVIKRGYEKLIAGKQVLVVEDVLTTGGSAKQVVVLVRSLGGEVVGVGALCNRGDVSREDLDVGKLAALINVKLDAYEESECPLCKMGVTINTSVGHGKEFLARTQTS